ncbi:hypothetical protein M514_27622 [Trichuris suis]|uniref:Reverse transcriptase zinc-binding domain-containing protein n=1 Tax=Trichuris suis TaxID=68888 RepID=A0A085MSL0_9BILA|nr:hypothetical protein M514_27622 [Trichuris suis]
MVRQAVKRILHLPVSSLSNDFIHLSRKKEGLGFINLQETADPCTIGLLLSMSTSAEEAARRISELWLNQRRRSRLMRRQGVQTFDQAGIHAAKISRAAAREDRFMASYQGAGYKEFRDWRSNGWITGEGMTGHSFIAAVKVRTSLVPTRLQTLRGRAEPGDQRVLCRKCGAVSGAPESVVHISQNCAFTGGLIIRRHNDIMEKLMQSAEASGFHLVHEPVIRLGEETFKPDLLLTKEDFCWVLDVAVTWESNDSLNRRHAEKCRKYERLKEAACKLTGGKDFGTGAVVIGARGDWCSQNDVTFQKLGWNISERLTTLLCTMALERTVQLVNWFTRSTTELAFRAGRRGRHAQNRT